MEESIRFWKKVKVSHCWLWHGAVSGSGYGRFRSQGRVVQAHRYAYEQHRGKIPEGMVLDHLCRNKLCVNPDHLEVVTEQVNILRGTGPTAKNAVKTHCPRGHALSGHNAKRRTDRPNGRECRQCSIDASRRRRGH